MPLVNDEVVYTHAHSSIHSFIHSFVRSNNIKSAMDHSSETWVFTRQSIFTAAKH